MAIGDLGAMRDRFLANTRKSTDTIDGQAWDSFDTVEGSPTLVALPGAVGGGEGHFCLAEQLRSDLRVVAAGLPAFSRVDQAVPGLRALLQARGVSRPILLGASFSGLLVQAYVRAYPEDVSAIVLSHTGALDRSRVTPSLRAARVVGALPASVTRLMLRLLVRVMVKDAPQAAFWRDLYSEFLDATGRDLFVSRYLLTADLCATAHWSRDDLRDWPGRVLIIDSDDDKVASERARAALRELYPQAEVASFKGTGHSTAIARPEEYALTIRRFILGEGRASPGRS